MLYLALRRQGGAVPTDSTMIRHFAVAALIGNILPFTLLAWGEQHVTSALPRCARALDAPVHRACSRAASLHERLNRLQVVGLGVGVVGVATAAGVGASDLHGSSLPGAMASVLAGVLRPGLRVHAAPSRRHPPLVASTGQLTAGAVVLFPVAAVTSVADGVALTPTRVASVVLLGVLGTGLAYVLNYRIIADVGPTKASLVTYLIPVVAVVVGIVVLDEPFEWRLLAGGALTVAGIAAVNSRRPAVPHRPSSVTQ